MKNWNIEDLICLREGHIILISINPLFKIIAVILFLAVVFAYYSIKLDSTNWLSEKQGWVLSPEGTENCLYSMILLMIQGYSSIFCLFKRCKLTVSTPVQIQHDLSYYATYNGFYMGGIQKQIECLFHCCNDILWYQNMRKRFRIFSYLVSRQTFERWVVLASIIAWELQWLWLTE